MVDTTERKRAERELEEYRSGLEELVRERTVALAETNAALEREMKKHLVAKAALAESETQYRVLFHSNPLPMWVIDLENLGFLEVNLAAVEHYGYSRQEFLSMSLRDIRPAEDVPAFTKVVNETEKGFRHPGVWRHVRKDRSMIDVEITTHNIAFGGREGRLVLANDVTEQRRAEAEVNRLNAELEARVRDRTAQLEIANRELEAFSYSVSHDLRAPLRAIEGFSAVVLENYGGQVDSEGQRLLGVVRQNARRMSQLIDDLLTFSRSGRSEMKVDRVNMAEMARSAFEETAAEPERRARIEFRLEALPEIDGDPALLRQVWINLLSNAVKFSAGQARPKIEVEGAPEDGFVVYRVRDNGAGFDMAFAQKLFGVFQRLHTASEFEGTGIGLALVQRIVTRHGGRVWAESAVGQGAAFSFRLPISRVEASTPP
jgi:PAS domain S-box-containing protein